MILSDAGKAPRIDPAGPHAHVTGAANEDEAFVAIGASIFQGTRDRSSASMASCM